jgi:hypothetical protein
MKDFNDVLRQKEADLARVQKEVEALELVISLLEERPTAQAQCGPVPEAQGTGTEGPISSSLGHSASSFWKRMK